MASPVHATAHPQAKALLDALSDAIGAPLVPDAQGDCALQFEGQRELVVGQIGAEGVISLRCAVTPAGEAPEAALLEAALACNYTHMPPGQWLALDRASHRLVLLALIDSTATPRDDFLLRVSSVLAIAPQAAELLAAAQAQATSRDMVGIGGIA